jgi:hypothetical protein
MKKMFFTKQLESTLGYIVEAAIEVFSPNHDSYPAVGIHPFEGEPFNPERGKK